MGNQEETWEAQREADDVEIGDVERDIAQRQREASEEEVQDVERDVEET